MRDYDVRLMSCIVCNAPGARRQAGEGDFARFDCPRCGSFAISGSAEAGLERLLAEVPLRKSLMSHTLRRMQLPADRHIRIIRTDDLPTFWRQNRLPTPLQQADNFILWLGDKQETPFAWAEATASEIAATVGIALSSGGDSQGWGWLHSQLEPKNLYRLDQRQGGKVGPAPGLDDTRLS
jgi:hypothetical protein